MRARSGPAAVHRAIRKLRERITLLRHTQAIGVLSLLLCTGSLFALFLDAEFVARLSFGGSPLLMLGSLGLRSGRSSSPSAPFISSSTALAGRERSPIDRPGTGTGAASDHSSSA
ncbi:MAG: DUF2721 domain-containing protein [Panacagrimonas sp.]